jgi:Fe2+ or Zn2+ uptake regulation protein
MTTRHENRRVAAESLRTQLLAILLAAATPMTTAELLDRVQQLSDGVVNETVYHHLRVLEQRNAVARIRPAGRHVQWLATRKTGRTAL